MTVSPEQQEIIAGLYPAEEVGLRTKALDALYSHEGLVIMEGLAQVQVNDFVRPLGIDTEKFPFQVAHYSLGNPQELQGLVCIAQMVEDKSSGGDFGVTMAGLKEKDQVIALDASADAIKSGKSLIVAIHHPPIVDLGLGLYAVQLGLSERGVVAPTAMINNRTTAFLGVQFEEGGDIAPVPDMLGLNCQEVIYTMPASRRMKESDLAAEELRKNGINVQNDLATYRTDLLLQGANAGDESIYGSPVIVAVAITGTTDKELEARTGVIGMAGVKDRTVQMLAHENAVVLDTYITRDKKGNLVVKFVGIPYSVSTDLEKGRKQVEESMYKRAHLLGIEATQEYAYLGGS
jgi:hypothetical protein